MSNRLGLKCCSSSHNTSNVFSRAAQIAESAVCLLTNDGDHHGDLFLISCPNNSRSGIISTFSNIVGYKELVKSFEVSSKSLRGRIKFTNRTEQG